MIRSTGVVSQRNLSAKELRSCSSGRQISPDLHPIENYWNVIKRRVEKRKPENTDELEQHMNEEMRINEKKLSNEFHFLYEGRMFGCYLFKW
jgi:hypothetical protein